MCNLKAFVFFNKKNNQPKKNIDVFLSLHCQVQRDWQSEGLVHTGSKCPEEQWLCRLAPSVQVKMQCSFWK